MSRRALAVAALALALAGCDGGGPRTASTLSPKTAATLAANERAALRAQALSQIEIQNVTQDVRHGMIYVQGRVYNAGTEGVRFVKVELVLLDKTGQVIGKDSRYATSGTLFPGEANGFELSEPVELDLSTYKVHIIDGELAPPN